MGLKLELRLLKGTQESSGSSSSLPVSQGDTCAPCSHVLGMDIEREHFTSQPLLPAPHHLMGWGSGSQRVFLGTPSGARTPQGPQTEHLEVIVEPKRCSERRTECRAQILSLPLTESHFLP